MKPLEILTYPNPALAAAASEVEQITPEISEFLDQMTQAMHAAGGIGLAATQVGDLRQLVVIDIPEHENGKFRLINPKVVSASDETAVNDEGCLSLPGVTAPVKRPASVTVEALDESGKQITIQGEEVLAICLQHEIDHLAGVLFIDRISRLRKRRVLSQYRKIATQEAEPDY